DVGALLSCHGQGPNRNIYALVASQSPYIKERWRCRASHGRVGPEGVGVNAGPDDGDLIPGNSARHEVISGAVADGVKSRTTVSDGYWPLQQPDQRRHGPRGLLEYRRAEQVRNDDAQRQV